MKYSLLIKGFFLFLLSMVFTPLAHAQSGPPNPPPGLESAPPCLNPDMLPGQARVPCNGILVFKDGATEEERAQIVEETGATMRFNYHQINAAAVHVPSDAVLSSILTHSDIVDVIPDRPVQAFGKPGSGGGSTGQVVPGGVQRIGAAPGILPVTGSGVGVAIVDTGLDFNHPDLDLDPSDPCFTAYSSCQDDNDHGTHVGGIVAALNNSIDVVGVAPAARLYAVKVLNSSGSGSDSTIIAGLDWVGSNADSVNPPIRVINMSLGRAGTLNDNPALRTSIQNLTDVHNISVVVAAGNDATKEVSQMVPATYPEVMAIASTTANDGSNNGCHSYTSTIAADTASYFTTDGAFSAISGIGVTASAPGEDLENISRSCSIQSSGILSLKRGGTTVRMSGTSMATPHVTGLVALMEEAGGPLNPENVRCRIQKSASRLGIAPLNSPVTSYTYDGQREGILSAGGALNATCP
jgi:subtilisin